jgi:FSR family fosmidomycin resistance protein-like MFS transporter
MISRDNRVNMLIGTGHFLSHFYGLCLPPMFLFWQGAFQVSYAQLGLAVMLMAGTTAVLQTPVGFLVDRHGARRFLIGGILLMALGIAGMGLATAYWQVLVLAVVSGLGNSVIHPVDYAIMSGSVSKEGMARSFSIHTFNGNLGNVSAPPVIIALSALLGWREALLLVGLLGVPLVLAVLLQSGILADQARPQPGAGAKMVSGRQLLLTKPMLLFFGFYLLGAMAGAGVQAWLITVLHAVNGLGVEVASSALTGYLAGVASGVRVGGYAVGRLPGRMLGLVVLTTAISSALMLAVAGASLPGIVVIVVMFGAGLGLGTTRTPRDMMLKEAAPAGQIGKVFGFVSSGLPLGTALTPVPFGFLIDRGHPELVLVLVAVLLLASLLCLGVARGSARVALVAAAE